MKKLTVFLALCSMVFLTGCDLSTKLFSSSSEETEKETTTSTTSLPKKTTNTLEKKITSNVDDVDEEDLEDLEDMEAIDYNNAIIDLLDECMGWEAEFYDILDSDDEEFPDDFGEIFENTVNACLTAQEELQNYASFDGDSSLADATNEFLEVENTILDLYNEYFSLEEDLDEESEGEFWETMSDLDAASSNLLEQLEAVQEEFAAKYGFSLEGDEED